MLIHSQQILKNNFHLISSGIITQGSTEHCELKYKINFKYSSSNPQTNYILPGNTTAIQTGCYQQLLQ